jgi:long-chain acyl-CoA synthetase
MRQFEHFPNLVTMFFTRARENGDAPFLSRKRDGNWTAISWSEAARQVASLAESLQEIGLKRGDRVMLVSENRPEWCIADLGIMAAGCVTVPTYTTNTERDHQHIIEDSGATAVIVSTQKLAAAVMPAALRATNTHHIIGIEPLRVGQSGGVEAHDWTKMVGKQDVDVAACAANAEAAFKREDLACLIYTSGTGGSPRGVQQHHGSMAVSTSFRMILAGETKSSSLSCRSATPTNILEASSCRSGWEARFSTPKVSKSWPPTSRRSSRQSWSWCRGCSKCCGRGC